MVSRYGRCEGTTPFAAQKPAQLSEIAFRDMKRSTHNASSTLAWQRTLRHAMLASDPLEFKGRLHDAKHAIMDRIEDTMRTASQAERRMLGLALDIVSAMERSDSAGRADADVDYTANIAA
jgi:hypothetical protein